MRGDVHRTVVIIGELFHHDCAFHAQTKCYLNIVIYVIVGPTVTLFQ